MPRGNRSSGALFLLTVGFGLLIGRGTFATSDEGLIFNTALSLTRGSLAVNPGENVFAGADGRYYSFKEILPSLLAMPFVGTGLALERLEKLGPPPLALGPQRVGVPKLGITNWPIFLTLLIGPLCVGLTLMQLYRFVRLEDGAEVTALTLAAIAALATPLAVYAKTIFPQVVESALLMTCFVRAREWRALPRPKIARWLGVACGFAVLTRTAFLVVVPIFAAWLIVTGAESHSKRKRALFGFVVPVAAAAVILGWVNWLKWGSPFDSGLHDAYMIFSTDLWFGLTGLLVSPGKGLLLYAPVLLVSIVFAPSLWRAGRAEVLLALAVTAAYLGVYARWYDWPGGLAWGPRFLIPLIAPWLALTARALAVHPLSSRRWLLGTGLVGAGIQFLGASLYPHWIVLDGYPPEFSLTESHLAASAKEILKRGVDDYWLLAAEPLRGSYVLMLLLGMGLLALGLLRLHWALADPAAEAEVAEREQ